MTIQFARAFAIAATLAAALIPTARADSVADFYKGKNLTMIVGYAPGGINDIGARLVGRYLAKSLPGSPSLVVQNMPGSSGISAINHMFNVAPKDGVTIAIIGRAVPQLAFLGDPNIRFVPDRFVWLGSMSSYADDAYVMFIMADRPIKSWEELKQQPGKKIVLGAVGPGSTNLTFALFAKDVLHLNIDVIRGYPGAAPIFLAMQNHEVDGQVVGLGSVKAGQRALWDAKSFRALIQFGRATRHEDIPDAPTGRELVSSPNDRALLAFAEAPFYMALPFIAPPGIPADRAKALQEHFMGVNKDPAFVAEAEKLGLDVSPIDGKAVEKIVKEMASTPPAVLDRFKTVSGMR
jgi:tripartite-type tricarboxylate transporter receptor subunit TctC